LGQQIGESTQLFQVLWGLWGYYVVRANHQEAREVGKELLESAQGGQDIIYLMESHLALGGALFCLAEFVTASEHLEQGAALYEPEKHSSYISLFAADLGVFCSAWAAHPLWHIGYPDLALARSREAVNLAEKLAHPYSIAIALDYAGIVHQFRREAEEAYRRAEAAINICKEHKFAYYLGWAMIIKGWALAELGNCEEGTRVIQQGLKTLRSTEAKRSLPFYLSLLAEVYGKSGQPEKGLEVISEAFVEAQTIEERWWEAELFRLRGALLLQQGDPDGEQAKACFHQAIEVASRQNSISLELRAATSLYHLGEQKGKRNEAAKLLVEVHNRFTEGFDTLDFREAKRLLLEIS
jgi:predicted ATPase